MARRTGPDPQVIAEMRRAQRDFGASPVEVKANELAGYVESGLANLDYGDRDSLGYLQQRTSQGWKNPRDPYKATLDFLKGARAERAKGFKGSAGTLAQLVQRSAFPDRYDAAAPKVAALLEAAGGSSAVPSAADGASGAPSASSAVSPVALALLQQMSQPRQQPASAGVQAPSFSAAPTLAGGYQPATSGGGPAPASGVDELVAAAVQAQGQTPPAAAPEQAAAEGASGVAEGPGEVVVAPSANRDGVGLQKPILGFLQDVSASSGRPIDVTTGTNHNQFVAGTDRESDHWQGNATDLGVGGDARKSQAAGRKGDLIAAHAIQVASGRAGERIDFQHALALARRGGVFNFETPEGRVQVLWRTMVGGNHQNHVHVGLAPDR